MTDAGIMCLSCGEFAPRGSQRCPSCNAPLRLGGNQTQAFGRREDEETDTRPRGDAPTVPQPHTRRRHEAPPEGEAAREGGGFRVALREPDGEYEPGTTLRCRVVPGEAVLLVARVHNQTRIVDNFDLSIEGIPAEWWSVTPETVYLTPRDAERDSYEQEVEVRIAPPRSPEATAGEVPVRLIAASRATGARKSVHLLLSIEPFARLTAGLQPKELRSRYRARTRLTVRNEGNAPAEVKLAGVDPTGKLRFRITPAEMRVADEDEARVEVRAPRRIWIGQPTPHEFEVEANPSTGDPAAADGRLDHRPYLRPWVLLLVPLIAAAVAWYLQRPELRPVPQLANTTVRDAAQRVTEAGFRPDFAPVPALRADPADTVVDQSPGPGEELEVGAPVQIMFEQGAGTEPVPGVIGLTVEQARKQLEPVFQMGQVLPVDAPPKGRIAEQDPPAGELFASGTPVSVTLDPADDITASAPPPGGGSSGGSKPTDEPGGQAAASLEHALAYSSGTQIFVQEPGQKPKPVAGDAEAQSVDPTWGPSGGAIAYVHETSSATSEIRLLQIDSGDDEAITQGERLLGAPAYSPDGTLAMIDVDDQEFGGRPCLLTADGGEPACREEDDYFYYQPAWGGEATLYFLRRERSPSDPEAVPPSGWTEVVRFDTDQPGSVVAEDWTSGVEPVIEGDLQAVSAGDDGKIAVLRRESVNSTYGITILDDGGDVVDQRSPDLALCDLSWSGTDLVVMIDGCQEGGPQPKLYLYDSADLKADGKSLVKNGRSPALAPAG
jgi:hypothetical protein